MLLLKVFILDSMMCQRRSIINGYYYWSMEYLHVEMYIIEVC